MLVLLRLLHKEYTLRKKLKKNIYGVQCTFFVKQNGVLDVGIGLRVERVRVGKITNLK